MAKDQDYFLRVIDRSYPAEYLDGLKANLGGGYELMQASAKVAERVSLAVDRLELASYLGTAPDGAYATGQVNFYHTAGSVGYDYTVLKGSKFRTLDGRIFLSRANVRITNASNGPFFINVIAAAQGYEYNVPGEFVRDSGETLPGEVVYLHRLYTDVPVLDTTITIRQVRNISGGVFPSLDLQGHDLGVPRRDNEPSDVYRQRIFDAPDTVSLFALYRGILSVLSAAGPYGPHVREVGTAQLPGLYFDAGASTDAIPDPAHNFAYDMDPVARPDDLWKVWLDYASFRAYLIVEVPPVNLNDFGLAYDDTTLANAYDTIDLAAKAAAYDGFAVTTSGLYRALWETIDAKRAGGVFFDLYLNPTY